MGKSKADLKAAVTSCIKLSPVGDCSSGPHGPIGLWDVSGVTDMSSMFYPATYFNQDLSAWDVSKVTSMSQMFAYAKAFDQDLSKWTVSAVTDMSSMFYSATSFNHDLSAWDVSAVTNMQNMFSGATLFHQTLCSVAWVTSTANENDMFKGSTGSIGCTTTTTTTTTTTNANAGSAVPAVVAIVVLLLVLVAGAVLGIIFRQRIFAFFIRLRRGDKTPRTHERELSEINEDFFYVRNH